MNNIENHILRGSVIRTLLYFDIFDYPLKSQEVFRFLQTNHVTENDVRQKLIELSDEGIIHQFGEFFSIQCKKQLIERRIKGNQLSVDLLKKAQKRARLIASFPFVRSVMVSGSLSKGYADQKSDLDFFIITTPNRLWIARTLLVFYKRMFLFNSHRFFCVNYFIDTAHLEIEEKNLFTATELATLIPMEGTEHFQALVHNNHWVTQVLPNFSWKGMDVASGRKYFIRRILESIINTLPANTLDQWFQQLTWKRWKKLYEKKMTGPDFAVAFKTKDYASKNHPNYFQQRVLKMYHEKVKTFKTFGLVPHE